MGNVAARKQNMSIYTIMLILSTIFMLIAVISMYIEFARYAPEYWTTTTGQPAPGMFLLFP
jgi:hypothetical protein